MITILCTQPGFRRGGQVHPARAEYDNNHFTKAQMDQIKAEPKLTVIRDAKKGEGDKKTGADENEDGKDLSAAPDENKDSGGKKA